ncbi:glutathione S-transferase [Novosphingobium kunmingense]|uniref:Glutathione S-transferase n=1 Tax=Novosphingobium kunmingense TaxID=1211806 RepID=A0A2N0I3N8_9SPHN|nr:glutathione S-transferase family protein [Novosphingobium kunmingense]PKB25799.1 glutathione S-transferase [Novosphingobium kunmingense]
MIRIFGFPLSPFVRKVHIIAAEKGIPIEMVLGRPGDPAPEFLAASPFRKIPAMQDGDFNLCDSTAIVTYLEAIEPSPSITPGNARQKARAIWFEEFADTILVAAGGKVLFNRFVGPTFLGIEGNEETAQQGVAELGPILDYLESQCGDGWLAGDNFSVGDVAVAVALRSLGYIGLEPDPATHPRTAAWYDRVKDRESWKAVAEREAKVMERVLTPAR